MKPPFSVSTPAARFHHFDWLIALGLVAATVNLDFGRDNPPAKSANAASAESEKKPERVKGVPPRDVVTKKNLIDLSEYYNGSPREGWLPDNEYSKRSEKTLPIPLGVGRFDGVDFDVRGLIQLGGTGINSVGGNFPEHVKGIKIGLKCRRLYFLHATIWVRAGNVDEGVQLGTYVVHFADGSERESPIVSGEDVQDWTGDDNKDLKRATVVWAGENPVMWPVRIYKSAWENPQPDKEIKTIDYVSTMTKAGPFLIAITAE